MGIDIALSGRVRAASVTKTAKPRKVLQQAADLMAARFGLGMHKAEIGDEPGGYGFTFDAHPAAELISVFADDAGRFRLEARTTLVGPGYHAALCELADDFAKKLNVEWSPRGADEEAETAQREHRCWDDTEYFFTRDFAALERAFDEFTRSLSAVLQKSITDAGADGIAMAVGMPVSPRYMYKADVLTPIGPRNLAWVRAATAAPSSAAARSIYPWWHAERDARHHLGRALSLMWQWSVPDPGGVVHATAMGMALDEIATAYEMDPALDYPWADVREMCQAIADMSEEEELPEEIEALFEIAHEKSDGVAGTIGYRRGMLGHDLPGGWTIRLPGRFDVDMEEESTWMAYDATTTVRVSSMRIGKDDERPPASELIETFEKPEEAQDAPLETWTDGETLGRGYFFSESDKEGKYTTLMAAVAGRGTFAFVTISFDVEEDREMVVDIWKSIRPPSDE